MSINTLSGILFAVIWAHSMSALSQKPLHLDCIRNVRIVKEDDVKEDYTNVFKYDSLNRYIGNEAHGYTLTYDEKGRLLKARSEQKNTGNNVLKDVTIDGVQAPDATTVLFFEECAEYDERGNVVVEYSKTNHKYRTTYRNEFTYDKDNRRTSYIRYDYSYSGDIADVRKHTYLYNKKGTLTARKEYTYEGSRFWQGNKIVETEPRWKEIAHDLCDKDGNIVLHSDYDNNDTIRYAYTDGNRMVSKELYREGKLQHRVEYNYDQHGNVISADVFNENMKHEVSHHIEYDLNAKAADTGGIKQELHLGYSALQVFIHKEIDYKPKMVNIPVHISHINFDYDDEVNTYFYYSDK